ncbi:Protein kinase [Zostera marina]|uniref:Protein kinase n=1 Tax=Zostera marina TaxID=29655 RepID=A0A0K9NZ01_ZOSMR|nr:Protein kinase [Zostera marina]
MGRNGCLMLFGLLMFLIEIPPTTQLQSSQSWALLRLQRMLNYPPFLAAWTGDNLSDVCSTDNPSATVVCYDESITQLEISGNEASPSRLPESFSIESFFVTLTGLPNLKVLKLSSLGLWGQLPAKIWRLSKLEILNLTSNYLSGYIPYELSFLTNLHTLILDENNLTGPVPDWFAASPMLTVLSITRNSLTSSLPESITTLSNLRVVRFSGNNLTGELPDLSTLTNLQLLDLDSNTFSSDFPKLQRKVTAVILSNNKFTGALPPDIGKYYLLHHLDISSNRFVGPLPAPVVLNLPSIQYLNISGNRFTGMLLNSTSCSNKLRFVDLSSNLLTGEIPICLNDSSNVKFEMNCLDATNQPQHKLPFCQINALAVGFGELPPVEKKTAAGRGGVICGAFAGGMALVGVVLFFGLKRANTKKENFTRTLAVHASYGFPSQSLHDSKAIKKAGRSVGISPYRSFSLEEIESATNNFESSALIEETRHCQVYAGKLKDDNSYITIRCLKMTKTVRIPPDLTKNIELIAKLRHRHLVSSLGHCFEYCLDDSSLCRLFLIFEHVPNGTLRTRISGDVGRKLSWTQRISAAIGVAKGIQFLHGGMMPGLFSNHTKSTNILLDQNLVAKISSYNLPLLCNEQEFGVIEDKIDVYDFGVVLLEIVTGKPIDSQDEIDATASQLKAEAQKQMEGHG